MALRQFYVTHPAPAQLSNLAPIKSDIISTANIMTSTQALAQQLLETMPAIGQSVARGIRMDNGVADAHSMIHIRTLHMLMDGPKTFKQLCASRGVAPPTLSKSIDAMVKRGWLERTTHPDDKRQVLLQSTAAGKQHFSDMTAAIREHLSRSLQTLTAEERSLVAKALRLLKQSLDTP